MNDERFQRMVGSWLRDEDLAPPDSLHSARQVAARLPLVRQQSRWWPLPLLRGTPTPARATDTTEYQPNPIPATNGHSPIAIGRTPSMLSPVKAITAGVLVFAIGGAFLIAQPFQQQGSVPGAATDDPAMAPSFFSGRPGGGWTTLDSGSVAERREDGVVLNNGWAYSFAWDANDPRITGTATITTNETDYREGAKTLAPTALDGAVRTGLIRIVNDEGSWEGTYTELEIDDLDFVTMAGWLTGTEAYEGLSAYLVWDFVDGVFRGHITAEGPPPVPEGLPE